jgi:hypothetical protein
MDILYGLGWMMSWPLVLSVTDGFVLVRWESLFMGLGLLVLLGSPLHPLPPMQTLIQHLFGFLSAFRKNS